MTLDKRSFLLGMCAAHAAATKNRGEIVSAIDAYSKVYSMHTLTITEKCELVQFLLYANSVADKNLEKANN